MPNPARNEVEVTFDGKVYLCRPTFQSVSNIENLTGESIFVTGQKIVNGLMPVTRMAQIMVQALKTSEDGGKLTVEKVGPKMVARGTTEFMVSLGNFCLRAFAGPEKEDEVEEEEADEGEKP